MTLTDPSLAMKRTGSIPDLDATAGRTGEVAGLGPAAAPVADVGFAGGDDDVEGGDADVERPQGLAGRDVDLGAGCWTGCRRRRAVRHPPRSPARPGSPRDERRGALAGGRRIVCEGSTVPSGSTLKTLMLPSTLLM